MVNSLRMKNEELQHKVKPKREMSIIQMAKAAGNQAIIQRMDPPGMITGEEYELLMTKATGIPSESEIRRPHFSEALVKAVWDKAPKDEKGYVICEVCKNPIVWEHSDPRKGVWDVGHRPGIEFWRLRDLVLAGKLSSADFLAIHEDPSNFRPEHSKCNQGHTGEMPK